MHSEIILSVMMFMGFTSKFSRKKLCVCKSVCMRVHVCWQGCGEIYEIGLEKNGK